MLTLLSHSSSHSIGALVARTLGVVLLTPLILLAGIVAVVALTAIGISRHHGQRKPVRRPAAARALVLRLEPVSVETGLAGARRRAA
jgi:hypothetical protein